MNKIKIDKLKLITHILALLPLLFILLDFFLNKLGANPIRDITLRTGRDALALLIITLTITPLAKINYFKKFRKLRRTLGLYSFGYIFIHFLIFIGLDYGFNYSLIVEGITQKPFALAGFATFVILIPLALTSTNGWMKRLGTNWKKLHQLIYVAAILDILHFYWQARSKGNYQEPLIYLFLLLVLFGLRFKKTNLS